MHRRFPLESSAVSETLETRKQWLDVELFKDQMGCLQARRCGKTTSEAGESYNLDQPAPRVISHKGGARPSKITRTMSKLDAAWRGVRAGRPDKLHVAGPISATTKLLRRIETTE